MNTARKAKQITLILGDFTVYGLSVLLAFTLDQSHPSYPATGLDTVLVFLEAFPLIGLPLYLSGLWNPEYEIGGGRAWYHLLLASFVGIGLESILLFFSGVDDPAYRSLILVQSCIYFVFLLLWRQLVSKAWHSRKSRTNIAFIGYSPVVQSILQQLDSLAPGAFEAKLVYVDSDDQKQAHGLPFIATDNVDEFISAIREHSISTIVIGSNDKMRQGSGDTGKLISLMSDGISFTGIVSFYEAVAKKIPIGLIDDKWFFDNIDLKTSHLFEPAKRFFDILFSVVGLVVSSILWPLIAVMVKLSSPGPVFFRQTRLGRNGQPFVMIKFRTMRTDKNDFAPTAKVDPRVTPIGLFLRKSRLDEIPQLINILKGEMSFVGPRPERPELAAELEKVIPFYNQRLLVKPGLTGWDQVSGEYHSPSVEDTYKKLQYDLYYVKNQSPAFDVEILIKTVKTVFQRAGQ